jgi:hypothetical protein
MRIFPGLRSSVIYRNSGKVNGQFNTTSKRSRRLFLRLAPTILMPPLTLSPKNVIPHYRNAQGWVKGGDRHCPLL